MNEVTIIITTHFLPRPVVLVHAAAHSIGRREGVMTHLLGNALDLP